MSKQFRLLGTGRSNFDAKTAEHGSRMNAMRSATDAANEMIDALKQQFNQERQLRVTNEILEIINGANALNDNKKKED